MKPSLQNNLFQKYPKIFRQRKLSATQSCMAFGIDTGDGWYNLIDMLCDYIQKFLDNNKHLRVCQFEASQVKSKYGSLRFYNDWDDAIDPSPIYQIISGAVSFAEWMSSVTCEKCGDRASLCYKRGWYATLCPKCMKKDGFKSCGTKKNAKNKVIIPV